MIFLYVLDFAIWFTGFVENYSRLEFFEIFYERSYKLHGFGHLTLEGVKVVKEIMGVEGTGLEYWNESSNKMNQTIIYGEKQTTWGSILLLKARELAHIS